MELPENFRIHDGAYQVKLKKGWESKTNFTMVLYGEMQHPQDTMYLAKVQRNDGVSGLGSFFIGDVYKPKDFATALNRSTSHGGLVCFLSNQQLATLMTYAVQTMKNDVELYRKDMVVVAGRQPETVIDVLNPTTYINISRGTLGNLDETSFVWLHKQHLRPELERNVETPTSVGSLAVFLDEAHSILGEAFGPALIAWGAMYAMNLYEYTVSLLRHFNLPVLYGEPMAGKTLIATCAAWLNGCPTTAIASRCTLSFVTYMVTSSTHPFVWDDPSTPEEVCQLAVDIGNSACRGKATEEAKVPKTACLVTANFNMGEMLKYFSRILLITVPRDMNQEREMGAGRLLEACATKASAALPMVLKCLSRLTEGEIFAECHAIKEQLPVDSRILEGVALQLAVVKRILTLCNRDLYVNDVTAYFKNTMVPSYLALMNSHHATQPPAAVQLAPTGLLDLTRVSRETAQVLKNGQCLAVKHCIISSRKAVLDANGQLNKATRQMGRTTKMCHIPRAAFTEDTWRAILSCIGEARSTATLPTSSLPTSSPPSRSTSPPPTTTSALTRTTSPASRTISPASRTTSPSSITTSPSSRTTSPQSTTTSPSSRTTSQPSLPTSPPSLPTSPLTTTTSQPSLPTSQPSLPTSPLSLPTSPPTKTTVPSTRTTLPKPQQQSSRNQTKRPVPTPRKISKQIGILTPSRVCNMEDVCMKCLKVGGKRENWVECEMCKKWFHTRCMNVNAKHFKEIKNDLVSWSCC